MCGSLQAGTCFRALASTALGDPHDVFVSADADRPHCTTCLMLSAPPACLWCCCAGGPWRRTFTLPELAPIRLHGELYATCLERECGGRAPQASRTNKNKKVPRGEARHCSVRGRRSRRDRTQMPSAPKRVIALAVVTAPTSRALSAGCAAGDDPVSPDGHEPARLMPPWPLPRGSRSRPSTAGTGSRKARARVPSGARGCRPFVPA
jgi:hypothetical protein